MPEMCLDCQEIRKLEFRIGKTDLSVEHLGQQQETRDIEHELMIQNITTRMDTMSQDFLDLKQEVKNEIADVKKDIASVKKDIPDMFDNAINKLLAKMFKAVAIGVLIIVCVIILAFSRPVILKGIDEIRHWVETVEVTK